MPQKGCHPAIVAAAAAILLTAAACAPDDPGTGAPEPAPGSVTVPAGTVLHVELNDFLDSDRSRVGETFTMTVLRPVIVGVETIVPRGTVVIGEVTGVRAARGPRSGGRLVVRAAALSLGDHHVPVAATIRFEGEDNLDEDLQRIGVFDGIAALVGGADESAPGAVVGGIAGAGSNFVAGRGEQVELSPGTQLVVELDEEIEVPVDR